jgi:predicted nucleic acid-binding Zn ribbon protein
VSDEKKSTASMEDPDAWQTDWQKHCIVCGKSVLEGQGFAHLKVEGEMVAICCPLCFETFEKDPKRYLTLRRMRQSDRQR